jgi:DNA-binding transcriptional ArsR family regulator
MPQQLVDIEPVDIDRVFHALADPTRRAVVERLGLGPAATSELARPFTMALPSFIQHLEVLEKVGLVTSAKEGRVRTYRLTPQPLEAAEDWMAAQRQLWEHRLDQLDDYVRTLHLQRSASNPNEREDS